MPIWKLKKVGKADPHHQVAAPEKPVPLGQAGNLFLHDQWSYLTIKLVAARFARLWRVPVGAALSQPLDLDLAERVTDPLGGSVGSLVCRKSTVAGWESIASPGGRRWPPTGSAPESTARRGYPPSGFR